MVRRRPFLLILFIFCLIGLACTLLVPEPPLPTVAPTADSLAEQGNLGQQPEATRPLPTLRPTEVIPTASSTSPPTPTDTASPLVEGEAIEPNQARETAAPQPSTAADIQPTPFPTVEFRPPTVTPSTTPSPAPTNTPVPATSTPTPVSFPRAPVVVWPTLAPFNLPAAESPRHGVGVALGGAPAGTYGDGAYSWTYSWTSYVPPIEQPVQHVPMLAGNTRDGLPPLDQIMLRDGNNSHNYWLVFNECEHQGQCNATPAEVAQFFHDRVVDLIFTQGGDPDAQLIIGGVNAHPCGILWLKNFVDYYRANYGPLPNVGWHFHLYPEMRPDGWPNNCGGHWGFDDTLFPNVDSAFNLWREHANNALAFVQDYGEPDDEIWFTEIGCLNNGFHQVQAPVCQADGFVQGYAARILGWLNGEGRWVTRYAWYTNWDTKYWITTHLIADAPSGRQWQYSSLGYWYSQIVPAGAVAIPWP